MLLTASIDRTARLSDAGTGRAIVMFAHPAVVRTAAFHPMKRSIATGADDGIVRLWRYDIQELAAALREATSACISPADRRAFLEESARQAEAAYRECERRAGRSLTSVALSPGHNEN
jgi:WD40 repeat protein